jgi:LPS sulfotransferase NodH
MPARLDAFPAFQRHRIATQMGAATGTTIWPALQGCLGILFTSRSGSTLLCREIEKRYKFKAINESLNWPRIVKLKTAEDLPTFADAVAAIVKREGRTGWFGFKAANQGLIVAETAGLLDAYLEATRFLLLLRRDLVSQAVSLVKAEQTFIWHSNQVGTRRAHAAVYSYPDIARAVRLIVAGLDSLGRYVEAAHRPCRRLFYEDFATGDFDAVEVSCDALGLRRRTKVKMRNHRAVEKIGDDVNDAWARRFNAEVDVEIAEILATYAALCEAVWVDPGLEPH